MEEEKQRREHYVTRVKPTLPAQYVIKTSELAVCFSTLSAVQSLNHLRELAGLHWTSAFWLKVPKRRTPKYRQVSLLAWICGKGHMLGRQCWLQNGTACQGCPRDVTLPHFFFLPPWHCDTLEHNLLPSSTESDAPTIIHDSQRFEVIAWLDWSLAYTNTFP